LTSSEALKNFLYLSWKEYQHFPRIWKKIFSERKSFKVPRKNIYEKMENSWISKVSWIKK
jgi:hypothetical protein